MERDSNTVVRPLMPKLENLAWGVGSLGTVTMITSISGLYLFYLVGVVKLNPVTAGFLIFISKLVDLVSDPAMGWLSDRTETKWGRRRPYMFFASFACAISLIILFSVPQTENTLLTIIYIELGLIFYALALTVFNVPYLAMPAEMTDDYHERSNIMSYRAIFLVGGGFFGSAIAGVLLAHFGGGSEAYRILGVFLATITLISMLLCVVGTKKARFTNFTPPKIPTTNQLRLFLINRPFLILGGVKAVQFLQLSAGSAVTLFFFINILNKDESLLFPLGATVVLGSITSLRIWLPIIRRYGKRETFIGALLIQALLHSSWLLATPTEPLWLFMIRAYCLGAIGGGLLICGQSMIMDTIELDRRLSGLNREGFYSSVFSFLEKTTYALGPLIIGFLLTIFGFDQTIPRGEAQPASAEFAIILGQAIIPAACSILMAIGLSFYKLDEETLKNASLHPLGQAPSSTKLHTENISK